VLSAVWNASGSGQLPDFVFHGESVEKTQFKWKADAVAISISELTAELFGGRVELNATLPLAADVSSRLSGTFHDLNAAALLGLPPDSDVQFAGRVSGQLNLTAVGTPEKRSGEIRFRAAGASVLDTSVDSLAGTVTLQSGKARIELGARSLGGTISFRGDVPGGSEGASDVGLDGHVAFERLGD